jgi:hypothetical protein
MAHIDRTKDERLVAVVSVIQVLPSLRREAFIQGMIEFLRDKRVDLLEFWDPFLLDKAVCDAVPQAFDRDLQMVRDDEELRWKAIKSLEELT